MKPNKKRKKMGRGKTIFYWSILAFPLLQFIIFYVGVNLNSFALAFQKFDYSGNGYTFVGFENLFQNFLDVFKEFQEAKYLQTAVWNSVLVFILGLVIGLSLGLLFSYYIYKKCALSKFYKTILFLPYIISSITLVIIYKYFVEQAVPEVVLKLFNIEMDGLLSNQNTEFGAILFFTIWTGFGVQTLIYSSSMSGISNEIVEAAKMDGITPLKEFLFIDIPIIAPTISVFVVSSVATLFVNQMNLFNFYGAEAPYGIYTIGYYIYRGVSAAGTTLSDYPYYAAFGLVMTMITIPITLIVRKVMNKLDPNEG
ncbi:MAG: sugar ABC transporter permease [Tyzzerella sp.]|nr:sugar ABC transporter permease [Tyzzerella sp.]